MKKFFKWALIIVLILGGLFWISTSIMTSNTKKHSPEQEVTFADKGLEIEVFYNRPFKKGRQIFGGLVPYGVVWRTGANEATTFTTNKDIMVKGEKLPAGEYTLWTIPDPQSWQVIFNSSSYGWGVNWDGVASRDPQYDVVNVTSAPTTLGSEVEQFTIDIEKGEPVQLVLSWDQTEIRVPITPAN